MMFLIKPLPLLSFLLLLTFPFSLYGQGTYVFAGTFNRDKQKEGIVVYKLDTISGKLTKISSVYGILNPSYIAIGSDSNYLYACTETQTQGSGYINSFRFIAETGTLCLLNRRKTSGDNPVYLSTSKNNKFLLCTNYTESGLDIFPLLADGQLDDRSQTFLYKEGSHATERQNRSHCHSVIFSPGANYILIPDLGADIIRSYRFLESAQAPVDTTCYQEQMASPASGPRHICFHPDGKSVYCVEEIGGSLSHYAYREGSLRLIERVMLHEGAHGDYNSADIHVSADGKFLYASNRGTENNLVIFAIESDGKLRRVGFQPTLGNHPRMFAITPDGSFLIVANQLSNNIVVFRRNKINGKLKPVRQKIKIENPSCIQTQVY